MKCQKCEKRQDEIDRLQGRLDQQIEWYKEIKKSKEDLRRKIDELMTEHKRILALYFR